jgi:hypothetical protein
MAIGNASPPYRANPRVARTSGASLHLLPAEGSGKYIQVSGRNLMRQSAAARKNRVDAARPSDGTDEPEFSLEREMTPSVVRWMQAEGLNVKAEFVTPWGICDLVGVALDTRAVEQRLQLHQTATVRSITGAALLLSVPDAASCTSTTEKQLAKQCTNFMPPEAFATELSHLIAGRFLSLSADGYVQKPNGWVPLHRRLVAIELKLARMDEVFRQAQNNLGFADESYAALPLEVARRVAAKADRWSKYFDLGIGLLGVTARECTTIIQARSTSELLDPAIQMYCVEKFWRTGVRGS